MSSSKSKKLAGAYRDRKRWRGIVSVDGVRKHLGMFDTQEEAHQAYLDAWEELGRTPGSSPPPKPVQERFDVKYEVDLETGCWNWTASKNNNYGWFQVLNENYAHRVSWILHRDSIPQDHEIDHLCRNPSCVNPDHLECIPAEEHRKRTAEQLSGEGSMHSKLTNRQVLEIRYAMARKGPGVTQEMAAQLYGVSIGSINHILSGKSWAHCKNS